MAEENRAIEDILDKLCEMSEGEGQISVGDIATGIGDRGYGPFLFVPALVDITPIGGIPGLPSLLALLIAIFAVQAALGRHCMWLPAFLRHRPISHGKMKKAAERLQPIGRRLDRWFPGRLPQLTKAGVRRTAAGICVVLCLSVPPLEIVPFATTAPMAAIAVFGLAMTLRDGLLMALGFAATLGAAVAVYFLTIGGGGEASQGGSSGM